MEGAIHRTIVHYHTMNKLIIVVFLGCLAVVDAANPFSCFRPKKKPTAAVHEATQVASQVQPARPLKQYDFDALNRYLLENVPADEAKQTNLAHLEANLDKLTGPVKKAAQLALNLVKESTQCSNQVLVAMSELYKSKLWSGGQARIEKVLRSDWESAMDSCDALIEASYQQADRNVAQVMAVMTPTRLINLHLDRSTTVDDESFLHYVGLIKKDPRDNYMSEMLFDENVWQRMVPEPDLLLSAIDKYLTAPCEKIVRDDQMLENMLAIRLAKTREFSLDQQPVGVRFQLAKEFKGLEWTRMACNHLLNMSTYGKAILCARAPSIMDIPLRHHF